MSYNNPVTSAGTLIIGYLLNWGLHGVLCAQVYSYYNAFPNDSVRLQCIVYGAFIIQNAETVLVTVDAYSTFATGFMKQGTTDEVHNSWLSIPIMGGIVGCIGQLFFAHRVKTLSQSYVPASIIALLAITGSATAIASGAQVHAAQSLANMSRTVVSTIEAWLAISATCNVVIAAIMTFYLFRRNNNFYPRTHNLISQLICAIVETGILSAVIAIVQMGLFIGGGGAPYHEVPALFLAKLYSNTMLVVFNNRISIVGGRRDADPRLPYTVNAHLGSGWRRRKSKNDGGVEHNLESNRREVWVDMVSSDHLEMVFSKPEILEAKQTTEVSQQSV